MRSPMYTAALFEIVKIWKQHKCPLMDECVSKILHMHKIEYYSIFKKKEIMTYAITWMKPEGI